MSASKFCLTSTNEVINILHGIFLSVSYLLYVKLPIGSL